MSPALAGRFFTTEPPGKSNIQTLYNFMYMKFKNRKDDSIGLEIRSMGKLSGEGGD